MTDDQVDTELEYTSPDDPEMEIEQSEGDEPELDDLPEGEGQEKGDDPDKEQADDPDADSAEDEYEEVEHSGRKYKVHKDLKPALMMHADYTRKTQEVAERNRALEAHSETIRSQEQALAQQAEAFRHNMRDYAQLYALDQQIEHLSKIDWARLEQEDFISAQGKWRQYQQLRDTRHGLASKLQQQESKTQEEHRRRGLEQQHAIAREQAKRTEETQQVLQRDIKGWNKEVAAKVTEFAVANGFSNEELRGVTDARVIKLLHRAWRDGALLAKTKSAAPKAEQAKPLTQVSKGRTAPAMSGLDDRLSADEWVKRRNDQLRRGA